MRFKSDRQRRFVMMKLKHGRNDRKPTQKRGVKVKTRFTRAYVGALIKDYGWHEVMRSLRKKFPKLDFLDDAPLSVRKSRFLGSNRKMSFEIENNKGDEVRVGELKYYFYVLISIIFILIAIVIYLIIR